MFTSNSGYAVLQINVAGDRPAAKELQAGQVAAVRKAKKIVCTSGRLWVTLENDFEDHILEANDSLELRSGGKVVVSAMAPSAFIPA
jgi:hypothetical protein